MRIGIIGAGLAGLAAAALLARRGHSVTVLERAEEPRPLGAGLLLQPPGADVLDLLGVGPAVRATAAHVTRLHATTPGGRTLLDLHYRQLAPGLHGLGIARPAIWSALLRAALDAGVAVRAGQAVVAASPEGRAVLARGDALDFELLVLAAGYHSTLWPGRRVARPYRWGCLWTTIALPPDWPEDVLQQRCIGTRVMVGVLPLGQRQAALYWSLRNDGIAGLRAAPVAEWHGALTAAWPEVGALAEGLAHADLAHATYSDVWTDPPVQGRLVAIGDAAHGTSPQLGQGTTQAFRDALALAEALAADAPLAERLAGYWAARRARTRYYRWASRALTPVFQGGPALLGWGRDLLAGPVGALPPVRRLALLTLAGGKAGWWGNDLAA